MRTFFKKHLAMTVTAPAFVLYIFLLPYKKAANNVIRDKQDIRKTEPGLERRSMRTTRDIDKTYAVSWIFGINTNQ